MNAPKKNVKKLKKNAKKSSKKCAFCNKKLTLVEQQMKCKCENYFCTKHRLSTIHNCTYNYIESTKEKLKEKMPVTQFTKVVAV